MLLDGELEELPADMLARSHYISQLIEEFGLERVREPPVKHLRGSIWEMRRKGRDGISRALYVTAVGKRVVVVRVFIKKTQKAPDREIDLAEYRKAHEELAPEFALARAVINARVMAGLTQEQLAQRMDTTQSVSPVSKAAGHGPQRGRLSALLSPPAPDYRSASSLQAFIDKGENYPIPKHFLPFRRYFSRLTARRCFRRAGQSQK